MDGVPNHHVDFRVFKTHSQKISTYTRRSLRRSYHRWPSYRIPQIFLGDPKIFIGNPIKRFVRDPRFSYETQVFHRRPQAFHWRPQAFHRRPQAYQQRPQAIYWGPQASHWRTKYIIEDHKLSHQRPLDIV